MAKQDQTMAELKEDLYELKSKLEDIEGGLEQGMKPAGRDVKEKAIEFRDKTGEKIEQNPFASVGVAFGAGVLAGMLIPKLMKK